MNAKHLMKSAARRAEPVASSIRPAYLSLHGWALGTLIEHGAVRECEDHGHMRDRTDPDAWNRAREEARHILSRWFAAVMLVLEVFRRAAGPLRLIAVEL